MTRIIVAAGAVLLAFTAPAAARDGERSFTHEGVTYTYTVTKKNGTQIIDGVVDKDKDFRLVVRNGWVEGYFGNSPVSFRAPKSKPATIASR